MSIIIVKEEIKKLDENIKKMQQDVEKNTPLVQLSTFGIFITLIISSVGIFKVADISLYILFQDRESFTSALILLVVTTICILAFVYIMQKIFFRGAGKTALSIKDFLKNFCK